MSDSLPPTPPSRAPNDDERRFETISSPCEWIEDYHPGGYLPVHLGDVFHDGQYKILRKLGDGSFSTAWLARDLKNNTYVALKILVSEISESTRELQIIRYIGKEAPDDGNRYITQLLDEFQHHDPNGVHMCLVFEPMGPSVSSMVEELPQFKPRRRGMKVRYPPWMAKRILKQALEGLAFLHKHGIAHGDFQPGNMLFALDNIDAKPEEELCQEENKKTKSTSAPVKRLDRKKISGRPAISVLRSR